MTKYLGVAMIVLGTIMLVVSYISGTLVNSNPYQWGAMAVIIAGVVLHIIMSKRAE